MREHRKILILFLITLCLIGGLLFFTGCGEEKAITESQIADYNKPGIVYVVTTWEADVDIPVLDIDTVALTNYLAAEVLAGRVANNEDAMFVEAILELLSRPEIYFVPSATSETRTITVTSSGNGFLVSPDGYVVTNAHLVKDDEENLDYMMAEEAATNSILDELASFEEELGFELTDAEAERFMTAGLTIYADYLTVGKTKSKTQVYTGNMIDKAREEEKGLTAEEIEVGDPIDMKEDTGKDIAILKINKSNLPTVQLGDDSSVRDGDRISALGYISDKSDESGDTGLKEDKPSLVSGTVAGHREMEDGWDVLQLQIPLRQGSSGSPILNNNGDVIGVETFGRSETDEETGTRTEIETENFAIPVSVVKEFMNSGNVTASEGPATTLYREGVDLFHEEHYSAAKKKFEEVKSTSSDFPFIDEYISECQDKISKGLDKGTFPWLWVVIVAVIGGIVAVVVLVVLLVVLPQSKKKKEAAQGGPTPPAGTAPPAGPATPAGPAPPVSPTPPASSPAPPAEDKGGSTAPPAENADPSVQPAEGTDPAAPPAADEGQSTESGGPAA
ncbi:MAG: trypsin-like peptidase domain-containing protein [Actinobacteria bacterium]|nr:trypsin-like peptidase domain-containing protein [Actinomycetota bacterium]